VHAPSVDRGRGFAVSAVCVNSEQHCPLVAARQVTQRCTPDGPGNLPAPSTRARPRWRAPGNSSGQADAWRVARLKKAQKVARLKARVTNLNAVRPWHNRCPKCHAEVHIRKPACDCGHQFSQTRICSEVLAT
jgi:hypothetical protein